MFERIPSIRISERPYVRLRGLQVLVDFYPAFLCKPDPSLLRVENVRDRTSSSRDHDLLGSYCRILSRLLIDSDKLLPVAHLPDFSHFLVCQNRDVPFQILSRQCRDFRLFFWQELWISTDNGYFRSHAGEEVAVFSGDVAAPDNRDALWQLCQLEDRVACMVVDLVKPFDVRDDDLRTYTEKNHLRRNLSTVDLHRVG